MIAFTLASSFENLSPRNPCCCDPCGRAIFRSNNMRVSGSEQLRLTLTFSFTIGTLLEPNASQLGSSHLDTLACDIHTKGLYTDSR